MSKSNPYYTPRYRIESAKYTWQERLDQWKCDIQDWFSSFPSFPEKEYSKYIQLKPGEEGYENAPYCSSEYNYIERAGAVRYEFKDGEYKRVDDE